MPNALQWTATEEEQLVTSLERALGVAAKARNTDHGFLFQIFRLQDPRDGGPEEFRELLDLVRAIPALNEFNKPNQNFIGNCLDINYITLIRWMISRAQIAGSRQTIRDLAQYLETETLEVSEILTIDGISITESMTIGDYALMPWDQLPMSDDKWHISMLAATGGHFPNGTIVRNRIVSRPMGNPLNPVPTMIPGSIQSMFDLLLCISAVVGAGIKFFHYWIQPPEWVPCLVQRTTFGVDGSAIPIPTVIPLSSLNEIKECASHFATMDLKQRLRMYVPLDRLNKSRVVGFRSVDAAIELGIALESLFAPTKLSEGIAHTVRTRAARFLGGSQSERHQIFNTLKDAYDLRSRAVHSGRFDGNQAPKKWKNESLVREVLENGQRIVGRSIVKAILEGEPNWEEFDLT